MLPTAAFGHFGRIDIDAPWEALNKVSMLRKDSGVGVSDQVKPDGIVHVDNVA